MIDRRLYMSARVAWLMFYGCLPVGQIDHRDLHKDNDAIANLRLATASQNIHNQSARKTNLAKIKGVRKTKAGNWQARITKDHKRICLGTYSTAEAAMRAYKVAAERLYGEFARAA